MPDPDIAEQYFSDHSDQNIGVSLGDSGLCSLDIDCEESFQHILAEFGIDPNDLWKYPTIQGSSKGRRIVFRVPEDKALPYTKLNWKKESDKSKSYTVFELRASCDGKSRFDMLPPSIHPDTKEPYKWIVQPPKQGSIWPEPPDWLISMWTAWDNFKPQLVGFCPWLEDQSPLSAKAKQKKQEPKDQNVIQSFIDAHDLRLTLEQYGYVRKGRSRYLSPHSGTNLPGVVLFPDEQSCFIHHASDPLCSEENGQPVNAFDLFCHYEHAGDVSKAVKSAAELLGLKPERQRTEQAKAMAAEPVPEQPQPTPEHQPAGLPFRFLGYNGNAYYYLPRGTEQVSEIKRGSHTSPAELLSLAPLEWWEMAYPKGKQGGTDWHAAANDCMRGCERRGIYSSDRERGRGAWYDKGSAVLHLGDRLLVDGQQRTIAEHDSSYIYTRQPALEHGADAKPADDNTAAGIAEMFENLNWHKPVYAQMLAGWCLLAPICGALSWRPHVWITAQRGAGKSWIQDHMVQPLLGPSALMVQGSTTEAGIRQKLKQDARPIVFDEAESEDHRSQHRMQTVIELARQSSSDSTAEIIKGTVSGHGMAFRMRSMFLLGSVNVSLSQAADESRFSVLSLASPDKNPEEAERWDAFSKRVDNTLSDAMCASLRARAYHLMPAIRKNAKTFSRAVAETLGSQRIGDQVGTLIAGACAYYRSDEIALEDAREWVKRMDFSDAKEQEQVSDEESCLQRILQSQIRFESERGQLSRSIGEVVDAASGQEHIGGIMAADANDVLKRYGLAVDGSFLLVSNKHAELEKLLRDTPWGAGWRRILGRIEGATSTEYAVRFAGVKTRAVRIPLAFFG
jgi:putative DNA primase/helicase